MPEQRAEQDAMPKQTLTSDCGHHCGVFVPDRGGAYRVVGHCDCPECHDTRPRLRPGSPEGGGDDA